MDTVTMQIDYTLTRDDYISYIKYLNWRIRRSTKTRFWVRIPVLIILVTLVLLIEEFAKNGLGFGISTPRRITIAITLIFLIITGSLLTYMWLWGRKAYQAVISEDSPLLGDIRLDVHETGLTHTGAYWESNLDWGMIRAVDDDSRYVYLLHDNGVGMAIPKRAFASQEGAQSFIAMVGAKVLDRDGSKNQGA